MHMYKILNTLIPLCFLGLMSTLAVSEELFKWTDQKGNTHYSDTPPTDSDLTPELLELPPLNQLRHSIPPTTTEKVVTPSAQYPTASEINPPSLENAESIKPRLASCFEPSPRATGVELSKKELTQEDHLNVKHLLTQIKGEWRGIALITECTGEVSKPDLKETRYSTDLEVILRRSKELSLNFEMYSSYLGLSKNEKMEFYLSDKYLSLSQALSDKSVLIELNPKGFSLWVVQNSGTGVHRELVRTIRISNTSLEVGQYRYANDMLVQLTKWSMKRY